MKIAIGSDHRGYHAKQAVQAILEQHGNLLFDHGCSNGDQPSDYPDLAIAVAEQVARGEVERGVLMCGSGIGMSIVANKVPGVRAALCHDELTAQMSRRHNDANVLCLAADMLSDASVGAIVKTWLETEFEGGRHARRVQKIAEYEQRRGGALPAAAANPTP